MKYLCMFVAFKIKTNKSEKGEIRKNLTTMKTGKTELPRSTSGADEFFIFREKNRECGSRERGMSSGNSVTPIVNPWQKMPITTKSGIT